MTYAIWDKTGRDFITRKGEPCSGSNRTKDKERVLFATKEEAVIFREKLCAKNGFDVRNYQVTQTLNEHTFANN